MTCFHTDLVYDNLPERLLEKMWGELKGNNLSSVSSLMNAIRKNATDEGDGYFTPPYSVEMFDPWEGKWEPFCLKKAWSIVKNFPKQFQLRMRAPIPYAAENSPKLWGWHQIPSVALAEYLSHCSLPPPYPVEEDFDLKEWREMVEQDKQAYADEGRALHWPCGDRSTAYLEREKV